MAQWKIIKRYGHEQGLSCVFKQFRAPETHCSKLHGYPLAFEVTFEGDDLDDRNWLISFGDLKPFKAWLTETFDHKCLVSVNDPDLQTMLDLEEAGIIDMVLVREVGCEYFAKMAFDWLYDHLEELSPRNFGNVQIKSVMVSEHAGNSAVYQPAVDNQCKPEDPYDYFDGEEEVTKPAPNKFITVPRRHVDTSTFGVSFARKF